MDFSKLGRTNKTHSPTHPTKIFEALPSLANTPNDLWRGQDKALTDWHAVREKQDVLISLNTGAGKTIVGLLIAQSLVNEGVENVIYVCSTIDLVRQTAKEADDIGINYTIRVKGAFSNVLFETGKAFCITTYSALFNGYSRLRYSHFPQGIVFDDAHVAESLLRDAFTLRISIRENDKLFEEIAELFREHFKDLGIPGQFADSLDLSRHSAAFVAPNGLYQRRDRLLGVLRRHGAKDHPDFKYPFAWLEDHLNACAAIFSRGVFELAPPFLPSLALDVFGQGVRRVYLSATLESLTGFVRAFGREPDAVITPSNDAGNGERLFICGGRIEGGFGPDFVRGVVETQKAVVAVPHYRGAERWNELGRAPRPETFSDALDDFRRAQHGIFVLVSRVDGIDLPHETCRIMVIDGLPSGYSVIERFQWEVLRMNSVDGVRVANRLTQLFGRINRGRNDYGAFLIEGSELNNWLSNDRNLALLPPLLQQQVVIGREMQTGFNINTQGDAIELVGRVFGRDEGWLDYYQREVKLAELDQDQLERHKVAEPFMVAAALSEARYAAAMWSGDPVNARLELERTVDQTTRHDTPLGGWHAVWLGAAYELEGDSEAAQVAYGQAMQRLGRSMVLPRRVSRPMDGGKTVELNPFGRALNALLSYTHGDKVEKEVRKVRKDVALIGSGSPRQAEVGIRALGEALGYTATRPDNDEGTGPDVLWRDEVGKRVVGFELKTDKALPATYFKKDISQGHDHLQWMEQNHPGYSSLGLLYVGPDGLADAKANPSQEMGLCIVQTIRALGERLFALIEDLRRELPIGRVLAISKVAQADEWELEVIVKTLWDRTFKDAVG